MSMEFSRTSDLTAKKNRSTLMQNGKTGSILILIYQNQVCNSYPFIVELAVIFPKFLLGFPELV